ncbi:MAG TPA: hypothetical protein VLB84_14045 [Bacteroidia bacterium]|nr:hypothetical protein [Bacteroidia bacterium]
MTTEKITIDIDKVLKFFDEKGLGHSSAIIGLLGEDLGLGLIKHYHESRGASVSILEGVPKEALRRGQQLDGWIKVTKDNQTTFYQTEVKNWNSHSKGGKILKLDCGNDELREFAKDKFDKLWDGSINKFKAVEKDYVSKVIKKMVYPEGFDESRGDKILPLLCNWYAISSELLPSPTPQSMPPAWSEVSCDYDFQTLCFFSMSIYLRELKNKKEKRITIYASKVIKRMNIFFELISLPNQL